MNNANNRLLLRNCFQKNAEIRRDPFWIRHRKICLLVCVLILFCLLILGLYEFLSGSGRLIPRAERKLAIFAAAVFVSLFLFEALFLTALAGKAPRFERIIPPFALALGLLYLFVITPLSVPRVRA